MDVTERDLQRQSAHLRKVYLRALEMCPSDGRENYLSNRFGHWTSCRSCNLQSQVIHNADPHDRRFQSRADVPAISLFTRRKRASIVQRSKQTDGGKDRERDGGLRCDGTNAHGRWNRLLVS